MFCTKAELTAHETSWMTHRLQMCHCVFATLCNTVQPSGNRATTHALSKPTCEYGHRRQCHGMSTLTCPVVLAYRDEDGLDAPGKRAREEDEFYSEAKVAAQEKKRSKKEARAVPSLHPPMADPVTEGPRAINQAIEKNRGLTPHRNKAGKNPRKKNRTKFEKATVRRKGQVQEGKVGAAGAYGGEQTGIKSRVSRSVRF